MINKILEDFEKCKKEGYFKEFDIKVKQNKNGTLTIYLKGKSENSKFVDVLEDFYFCKDYKGCFKELEINSITNYHSKNKRSSILYVSVKGDDSND